MRIKQVGWLLALLLIVGACSGSNDPKPAPITTPVEVAKPFADATPVPIVTEVPKDWQTAACDLPLEYVKRIKRGYYPNHSPDIIFVPREPNFFGGFTSTTHSGPWPYVQEVPLVFYGPGYIRSQGDITLDREVTVADLAPTLAELLGIKLPRSHAGRPLDEVLLPEEERNGAPKMILTVVWDGGGWDVLNTWPKAWPHLKDVMEKGTLVNEVTVGSSPSVTPAIHATIGTGTFPDHHGIVDIPVRDTDGTIKGAFDARTPLFLETQTLADIYDQQMNNESKIGMLAFKSWHLGMIGHGAYIEGGDKDIAVIAEKSQGQLVTNPEWYSLPSYLQHVGGFNDFVDQVDQTDGKLDKTWMGHEILDNASELRHSPVWVLYQTELEKKLFEEEGFGRDNVPDLFFVNYKQVDDIGHDYNMLNPEMKAILGYTDDALQDLIDFLDESVGQDNWVLAMTADHGQAPDPQAAHAWPIRIQYLEDDVNKHFDTNDNDLDLFQDERPVGFWVDRAEMDANGVTLEDISNFLIGYRLKENLKPDEDLPDQYDNRLEEPILAAAFPGEAMDEVWQCAKEKAGA